MQVTKWTQKTLIVGVLFILLPSICAASFFDSYGFGSRGKGMGNALTAGARDYHALHYNPALLMSRSFAHGGASVSYVEPLLKIERQYLDSEISSQIPERNMGFHIGISTPLGGVFADKVAFGATFYVPLIRLTRAETVDHGVPQFVMYENLQDKLLVLVGLAAQPWDWLNLGIGMQIMSDVGGDANVQISLTDRQVTRRQMAIDLHAELSMTAGLSAKLMDGLTLGVSFRESTSLHYRVPIYALIEEIGTLTFDIEGKSMFTPHQLNAGVNWRLPWLPLTLAADLSWAMWSMAPSPVPHAIIQIDNSQMVKDAPEGTVAKKIIDVESQPVPLEAQDIVIPRLGLEYQLGAFELRCGYFYRPTPVPTQVYQTNFADSDAHVFTFGAAWTGTDPFNAFRKPITLGLGFQWTQLSARRVDKVDPNDETGDYFIKGGIFSVGFDLQHDF